MKKLILISLLFLTSKAWASCSNEIEDLKNEIHEIRSHIGFYEIDPTLSRIDDQERQIKQIAEYLNLDLNSRWFVVLKPRQPKIEQLAEKLGYSWKTESEEEKTYPKWQKK